METPTTQTGPDLAAMRAATVDLAQAFITAAGQTTDRVLARHLTDASIVLVDDVTTLLELAAHRSELLGRAS